MTKEEMIKNVQSSLESLCNHLLANQTLKNCAQITDSIYSYTQKLRQHPGERVVRDLCRQSSRDPNAIEMNAREVAKLYFPYEHDDRELARKMAQMQYGEDFLDKVDGVTFSLDGWALDVIVKQPADYITIDLKVGRGEVINILKTQDDEDRQVGQGC